MSTTFPAINLSISVNQVSLLLDPNSKVMTPKTKLQITQIQSQGIPDVQSKNIPQEAKQTTIIKPKIQPITPISTYEARSNINLQDSKVNEVIGYILLLAALILAIMFSLTFLGEEFSYLGAAAPQFIVVCFFLVYLRWISIKFFINS